MKSEKVKQILSFSGKVIAWVVVIVAPQLILDAITDITGIPHIDLSESAQIHLEEGIDDIFKKL